MATGDAATVGAAALPGGDAVAGRDRELVSVIGDGVVDGEGGGVLVETGVVAGGTAVVGGIGAAAWSCWAHGCHSSSPPVTSASSTAAASSARAGER